MAVDLVLIRGLPGSGKSERARSFEGYLHYEPDHYFCDANGNYRYDHQLWPNASQWAFIMVDFALARNENVVVCDVFQTWELINPYIHLAKEHGASMYVYTCLGQYKNIHQVPYTIFNMMRDHFIEIEDVKILDCGKEVI